MFKARPRECPVANRSERFNRRVGTSKGGVDTSEGPLLWRGPFAFPGPGSIGAALLRRMQAPTLGSGRVDRVIAVRSRGSRKVRTPQGKVVGNAHPG